MTVADALNYPYIRVRDVEWLKRALLVFPHVVRMTPGFARGAPADDQWIEPFTYPRKDEEVPLLRPARLDLPHVYGCQLELRTELESRIAADPEAFRARFGKSAAKSDARGSIREPTPWERRLDPGANVQIHPYKLVRPVLDLAVNLRIDGSATTEMHRDRETKCREEVRSAAER